MNNSIVHIGFISLLVWWGVINIIQMKLVMMPILADKVCGLFPCFFSSVRATISRKFYWKATCTVVINFSEL